MHETDPDDVLREATATVLNAVLTRLRLLARLATERDLIRLEEASDQDLAPVRAQLDQIFGTHHLPALEAGPRPALEDPSESDGASARKRGGRPRKRRPEPSPDEEPRLD